MNPSASGWIKKRYPALISQFPSSFLDEEQIYLKLRENGFIYGTSLKTVYRHELISLDWTEEEMSKINLFDALLLIFSNSKNETNLSIFTSTLIKFYEFLNAKEEAFFKLPTFKTNQEDYLEKILQNRIQTNESILKKNFSHLLTNALLFLDVLAFKQFLNGNNDVFNYASTLEASLTNTIYLALHQKEKKKKET